MLMTPHPKTRPVALPCGCETLSWWHGGECLQKVRMSAQGRIGQGASCEVPLATPFLWMVTAICVSACAAGGASLGEATCDQTDSTVSCCLKQHPGQYEGCGAPPPSPSQPINIGPPGLRLSLEEEKEEEFRKELCQRYYERCIERAGLKPNIQYGKSHCLSCKEKCDKQGFWPWSANGKRCSGG